MHLSAFLVYTGSLTFRSLEKERIKTENVACYPE